MQQSPLVGRFGLHLIAHEGSSQMVTEREVAQAFERYGHLVLRRCRRILRDSALAEDSMQETFYRLWRYGDSFLVAESKLAWLWRVADRCCFDALSERRNIERVAQASLVDDPGQRTLPAVDAAFAERQEALRLLSRFEPRLQQVAVLHYVGELSQEEIGEATGWSRQTVNKKLALVRARARRLRAAEELQ
jgi:RNA polymerase sigma-70 factor (ECF subfamily)